MTTAYTSLLGLALPVTGELSGTWGDTVNNSITSLLDSAIAGTTTISSDADVTLTTTTGAANTSREAILLWTAGGTVTRNITAPAQSKAYVVINASSSTQSIVLRGVGPTTGVTIIKGESAVCAWNGSDFIKIANISGAGVFTSLTVTGTTTLSGLTASTALALDASKNAVSVTNTGTGNNVLATSPTLVTPALGTPSSGVMTNVTGINYDGFKNRIINGAMVIDQRNAGATVSSSGSFPVDRFIVIKDTSAGTFTAGQSSTVPSSGFTKSLLFTVGTAYTPAAGENNFLKHYIEGYNIADLSFGTAGASNITLSFWVRSSLTGTFGGALLNGNNDRTYVFSYTISAANTFEYKTISIPAYTSGTWNTTNTVGFEIRWGLGVGSTFLNTAGAWYTGNYVSATGSTNITSTAGATWYVTGVQLEKGSTATSFDYRPYGTELALCQRYYATCFWNVVTSILGYSTITTPVSMRTAPTIAGGGTGFAVAVGGAYSSIASQTSANAQTLTFTSEL